MTRKKTKTDVKQSKQKDKKNSFVFRTVSTITQQIDTLIIFLVLLVALIFVALFIPLLDSSDSMALVDEYEVNQIADKTIIAEHSIIPPEIDSAQIIKGEIIIKKGFAITEEQYEKLHLLSENTIYDGSSALSQIVFIFVLIMQSTMFFSKNVLRRALILSEKIFLASLFFLNYASTAILSILPPFNTPFGLLTVLPTSFSIILVAIMLGRRPALFFSFMLCLGVFAATLFSIVPTLFVLFSSLLIVFFSDKLKTRMALIYLSLILAVLNVILLLLLHIIFPTVEFNQIFSIIGVALNISLSGVLALGFLTPIEHIMNTASDFRLLDLSDLNTPLMKHMLIASPGTYNHSLLVATLAESACREIGANSLLARVGAYYHDIGKIDQPEYFVENQTEENKHNDINPRLSASVIKSHVKKGVEKAHQIHLPQAVIDIIAEHHGNALISYFYHEAKKLDEQTQTEEFSYSGYPPATKESAVVMLADTVEAACRTLERPSVSRLQKFIRQLVMTKYEERQLDKSNLTFYEVDRIQEAFVNILAGYYHSRVEYPNQKQIEDTDENENEGDIEGKND